MKTQKITYWITTILVSAMMLFSAALYLSQAPMLTENFKLAGLPLYFLPLLGLAKLLGAIALLVPKWSAVKEWAYAGFTFTFLGAIWVHVSTSTPFVAPLVALIILFISYYTRLQLQKPKAHETVKS